MRLKKGIGLLLFSLLVGSLVGSLEVFFGQVLIFVTNFRIEYFRFLIFFLPISGLLIQFLYSHFSEKSKEGMGLVLKVGRKEEKKIPIMLIPLVMVTTWFTHLFGGSAGREGVAVQIGATLSHHLAKIKQFSFLNTPDFNRRVIMIGMAAGFSGLFQTPLAASFFAVEVLSKRRFKFSDTLPIIVASFTAFWVSKSLGLEKFSFKIDQTMSLTPINFIKFIILGIIFGLIGSLFAICLKKVKLKASLFLPNVYQRIFIGGLLIALLIFFLHEGRYAGLGTNLISASLQGDGIYSYDFLLKMSLTILTLAIGFQGGEVTPLFAIGSSLGFLLAPLVGLPVVIVVALGYIAMFGSATNTFFAPVFIGAEVFGFDLLPVFLITMLVAYYCNFNQSIYSQE